MTPQETLRAHLANTITLTDSEFDHLFSHLKPSSFKKGQSIISEGDHVDGEYFVLKGCLKTFYVNEDQNTFILQFAMPTWWASDHGAIYGNGIATVNLDYIVNSDVLFLSNVDREKICRENYQLEYFFRWRSNKGFAAQRKRLLSLMNNDAKRRYEELMEIYPQLYNIVPKQLIAAYLGLSRERLAAFSFPHKFLS